MKKTITSMTMWILTILLVAGTGWAGSASNQQMMLDELEPYSEGPTLSQANDVTRQDANRAMLNRELEPYSEGPFIAKNDAPVIPRKNSAMLKGEMEPYNTTITVAENSEPVIDENTAMLMNEMEPYGSTIKRRITKIESSNIANYRMLQEELEPYNDSVENVIAKDKKFASLHPKTTPSLCSMCKEQDNLTSFTNTCMLCEELE